ncbi:MAG: ATP-binding protein [Candidatus Coatesbacteria bacterium]
MKLSVRFAVLVTAIFLVTVGFVWWLLGTRLNAAGRTVAAMSAQLAEQTQRERELKTKLSSVAAAQGAGDIATRAASVLSAFVADRTAELKDDELLASFSAAEEQEGAAAKILAGAKMLDQVIVTDSSGAVTAVIPANASLLGQSYLTAAETAACRKATAPRVSVKVSDKSPARLLTVAAGVRAKVGTRTTFVGVVVEVAAFENILKGVTGSMAGETETRFLLVDSKGLVALSPSPDLVGRAVKDSPELKNLLEAAEGQVVEVSVDLRRWMAVRQPGPLGMTVIGLGAISPAPAAAGAAATVSVPGSPFMILGLVAAAGLAGILVIVLLPLGRLGLLAKSAEALAAGSSSVEFKSAGANDEIGAAARALEKVGEKLSGEIAHREETASAYATIQRDLQRMQTENRELQEYQRNLESKARQQQAALEGEVATARQELENARSELETGRNALAAQQAAVATQSAAVAARDTAIAERDAALVQAGQHIQSLTENVAALQQSVESLSARMAEANVELDRRRSAPAAAFGLFAEASEALSVELAGLVELVQGYIGQLVEAGAITEEQQQFLSTVITRSARSQRLMGDLRDFSNIVRPDGLAREPIDLGALLTDVVGSAQEGAEARGITLDADVPVLPEMMGDEGRLRQLFTILFQNAVRFTPEGGNVIMRVGVREGVAGIRIEDSAESIPVKSEEVFDHFHPPDEEILALRGSGLRFPILRAIAAAHGGSIDLAITEQGSNLFFVRLPVRSEAPTADQTAALFAGVSAGEGAHPAAAAAYVQPPVELAAEPAAPAAETDAFAQAFAAFAASPAAAAPSEPADLAAGPAPAPAELSAEPVAPAPGVDAFAQEFAAFAGTAPAAADTPEAAAELSAEPSAEPAAEAGVEPGAPSAEADAFAQAFAAFAASPAAEPVPPSADLPAEPPAAGVETTESILAAPGEAPPGIGLEDLWTVPDGTTAPTVEAIENASQGSESAPGEPGTDVVSSPPANPPDGTEGKPFSFGSDEILTE